jgi:two-component system CheB/CheR fusion protein
VAADEVEPSENEQQLRFAANAVPALLSYVDRDGRYMWVNESYRRWFGYSPEEVRGRHIRDVLGESAWTLLQPYMVRALAGEEVTFESRLEYKHGPVRHVRATYTPHRDSSGRVRGFVVLSNDITGIKAAEEALRESERMLERSQSTAHVGSFEVTVADAEGRQAGAVKWSDETYRMFGYAPREISITHESFFDHVHPDDRPRMRANSGPKIQRGEPFENVFKIVRPDGTIRSVHTWTDFERDGNGKVIRMVGTCQDVTDRLRAEQELRKSEHMLERSQSSAHVGSWEVNMVDGENGHAGAVHWSAETFRLMGLEPGSVAVSDRGFMDYIHPDDAKPICDAWAVHIGRGEPFESDFRIVRPDGTLRWIHTWTDFERDGEGKPTRMVGTCQDITEIKSAAQELRDADRRKDEFLAMLSHELRNPLAPILSSIEIIERAGPTDEALRASYQGIIARQVQHMKRLLDDLLDVSRVSQGKIQLRKESVNLSALLLQAVEVSRPMMLEKRQQLAMSLAQEWLPLDADPTRIIQVFANLLNNASRYTHPRGHITLTSTVEHGDVLVSVRDDGMGMNPDLLTRAFELFVQEARSSDRAQGGLGVGLTLVRTLVKMHGGCVQAFSDGPGCGSEFVVRLPLATVAKLPAARPAPPPIQVDTNAALRVLVVDDNEDAAHALGQVLELIGHSVTLAHDGPGAIAAAAAASPELVLLDIGLPGMDGYAVAERLRAAGHDRAALVAISGYGQDDDLRRSTEAGFDHHLVKPVDGALLRKLIAEVSGRLARTADRT